MAHDAQLQLPALLVTKSDMIRLRRELEALEDYLHQAALRKQPAQSVKLPKTSRLLDEFATVNNLNLLHRADHDKAQHDIDSLLDKAPQLHFSFSAEPSSAFLAKLITWLRQNIDEHVIIQIGLQPNIAAGCIVRTANKQFDLSLRENFRAKRDLLLQQLGGSTPA